MYNFIWGHVYLYCWENNIDFTEVFDVIREAESEMYQNSSMMNYQPWLKPSNESKVADKLVGSTLELDINILTSQFNIPVEEIFTPVNYHKRLCNLLESLYLVGSEVYYDDDTLEFNVAFSSSEPMVDYAISKYLDFKTLTFKYCFSVDLHDMRWDFRQSDSGKVGFYNLIDLYDSRTIYLYKGYSDIIANYFNDSMRYEEFKRYKYDIDYRYSNIVKDKIKIAISTEEVISESYLDDYKVIDFKNIIVKESVRKCDKENHNTKIINGIFFILTHKTGELKLKSAPLIYCEECDTYFMYDFDYESMKMEGIPLYRISDRLHKYGINNTFNQLNTESIFKICGYNVDMNEDLSDQVRHNLLDFLISRDIVTVIQTLNFLQWLLNSRKNNSNMHHAIKKWENDFSYIEQKYNSKENAIFIKS